MTLDVDSTLLARVRKYARSVCRVNAGWDASDLESDLLHDIVRWPPNTLADLHCRMKLATVDWHRRKLGRDGQKHALLPENVQSFDMQVTESLTIAETLSDPCDMEESVEGGEELRAILGELSPRDRRIALMLAAGESQRSIAESFGVTAPVVNRRVQVIREFLVRTGRTSGRRSA